ncbi:MAG: hypothetical protein DMG89_26425 [Acidobacteria bacterium]|nr:MAG: hypothetical protein DMG89_26425 [Acidobacteriota bacterium]
MGSAKTPKDVSTDFSLIVIGSLLVFTPERASKGEALEYHPLAKKHGISSASGCGLLQSSPGAFDPYDTESTARPESTAPPESTARPTIRSCDCHRFARASRRKAIFRASAAHNKQVKMSAFCSM